MPVNKQNYACVLPGMHLSDSFATTDAVSAVAKDQSAGMRALVVAAGILSSPNPNNNLKNIVRYRRKHQQDLNQKP
jgi:orotidine-5'-phosphate decarboxylase